MRTPLGSVDFLSGYFEGRREAFAQQRLAIPKATTPKPEPPKRVKGEVFLRTREWRAVRAAFLKSVDHVCARCGSTHRIVVDHIQPRQRRPELALTMSNLQVLCWDCNMRKSNRK